ncbi:carbohydrate porin [Novosphingobium sp.]|uniref:carbohydrate porin n=1 Tax=Novosphingobium sp. TaxID=1874826 RepID=UPI003342B931
MARKFNSGWCLAAGLMALPAAALAQTDAAGPNDAARDGGAASAAAPVDGPPRHPAITIDSALLIDAFTTVSPHEHADGVAARGSVSATVDGARFGVAWLSANATLAASWGMGITGSLGDLQGVSSIAAPRMIRPVNAWLQWTAGHFAVKAGIIDTNADFDEQNTGAIFLNASHGMGAELAAAGMTGSGQAPYSALGVIGFVSDDKAGIKLRVGAFGGTTGDPDRPARLIWRAGGDAGHIVMAEIDRQKPGFRVALGGWRHTATLPRADGTGTAAGATGLFVLGEKQLAGAIASDDSAKAGAFRLDGWVRYGRAFTASATIDSYLGGGVVAHAPFHRLPDDLIGIALARAGVARGIDPVLHAETVVEASWQHPLFTHLLIQPDL